MDRTIMTSEDGPSTSKPLIGVISACPRISIIIPAFNESAGLHELHRRLTQVVDGMCVSAEFLYVNDGSHDDTLEVMHAIRKRDPRVALIDLSRNFGKEIAMMAGLDHATGEAVILIDADLQDPPELIPELCSRWREGYDVVYATRVDRKGESWLKKQTAHLFYRAMQRVGTTPIPSDTGDYRLLSRRAVDALTQLRERHRFMKGLFSWIGYRQTSVQYVRDPRYAGETKWNYWRLWNLAIEGFTSFTAAPLKISTYIGIGTALFAFTYGLIIISRTLLYGRVVPGYASLMVVMLFLGGIQLTALGILGEYVGRMFNEVKQRPLYLVQLYIPADGAASADEHPRPEDRYVERVKPSVKSH
jgi:polyisoprenyl-phosphate glycosyltransferase